MRSALHQQLMRDRLPDRVLVPGPVQAGRLGQDVVGGLAAGHRGGPQHLLRRGGQPLHPGQQQRGQAAGQQLAAGRGAGGQQFLGIVRIALGAGDHPVQRGRVQRARGQRGQVVGHVLVAERPQFQGGHGRQPEQLGHHRAERVTAVQVIGAVGDHHRDPLTVQHPAQEGHQVPGGLVGPVQVLQDEQHRAGGRQLREQPEHRAEQLLLGQAGRLAFAAFRAGPVRQQLAEHRAGGQRAGHRLGRRARRALPQRVGQRQVRDGVTQLGAPPGQHQESPVGGARGQLGDQAGLADPGVPGQQRVGGPPGRGVVKQAEQAGQFPVPADHPSFRRAQHSTQYHSSGAARDALLWPP